MLADALDLDMHNFWQAHATYWTRLPKWNCAGSPSLIDKGRKFREAAMTAYTQLKEGALTVRVAQACSGTRHLPDLLVTPKPKPEGVNELTTAGAAAIAVEQIWRLLTSTGAAGEACRFSLCGPWVEACARSASLSDPYAAPSENLSKQWRDGIRPGMMLSSR